MFKKLSIIIISGFLLNSCKNKECVVPNSSSIKELVMILNSENSNTVYLDSQNPDLTVTNFQFFTGSVWTKNGNFRLIRSAMHLDLNAIPNNAVIESAQIKFISVLDGSTSTTHGSVKTINNNFSLHLITSNWNQISTNWSNQPSFSSNTSEFKNFAGVIGTDSAFCDITTLVSKISGKDKSLTNNGFMIKMENESLQPYESAVFHSITYSEISKRPVLKIKYKI